MANTMTSIAAAIILAFAIQNASAAVVGLRAAAPKISEGKEIMNIDPHTFMEVTLGPFASEPEACDYCFSSFTKEGVPPAGPVAPSCVCMAYPEGGEFNMFCATPAAAAGYVAEKGGCRCKGRDMEHMAATTCEKI
mmetsp:Transcript_111756/g.228800  ORF Transcript_111756/g.228800 Transcript_111756/m.228800 type:complete len:136 (+) Transcript_111756:61-468(+)